MHCTQMINSQKSTYLIHRKAGGAQGLDGHDDDWSILDPKSGSTAGAGGNENCKQTHNVHETTCFLP